MIKTTLARFFYNVFRSEIDAIFVEDLLMQIPPTVHKPFIELVGARKEMMRKWIFFEVNSLLTRPPIYQNNPDRRQGMLMVFQAMLMAITDAKSSTEVLPTGFEIPARKEDPKKVEDGSKIGEIIAAFSKNKDQPE